MIRFKIQQHDDTLWTDWIDEPVKHGAGPQTAVVEMSKLRQQYPDAAISIERTTIIPKLASSQARFRIALPDNETRYSKVVNESEADALLTELQARFPNAKEVSRG